MRSPVSFQIQNRSRRFEHTLSSPEGFELKTLTNQLESGTLVFADDHPAFAAATAPGARIICTYRDEVVLSGRLQAQKFQTRVGTTEYSIRGDSYILDRTIAAVAPGRPWSATVFREPAQANRVAPGAPGTSEGLEGYYRPPAGVSSAEAAIKDILSANLISRLNRPVRIGPNLDRGGDARSAGILAALTIRFDSLREAVQPLLDWSGLVLSVVQNPGEPWLTIDVRQPVVWPQLLTLEAGVLQNADASIEDPTGTRIILLGNGEAAERIIYEVRDPAREAAYGEVLEVTLDATAGKVEWPDEVPDAERVAAWFLLDPRVPQDRKTALVQYFQQAGADKLADLAALAGVSAQLSETKDFHIYGADGIHNGDRVSLKVNGRTLHDRIGGATLQLGSSGFTATPVVGDEVDDEDEMIWAAIEDLRAGAARSTKG